MKANWKSLGYSDCLWCEDRKEEEDCPEKENSMNQSVLLGLSMGLAGIYACYSFAKFSQGCAPHLLHQTVA